MNNRTQDHLIAALKQALVEPGEQRLFRGGKLAGLFPSRHGVAGDAAAEALREELLQIVRSEARGKFTIEWVRITPKGVEFLHEHDSPIAVLRELQAELRTAPAGVPAWLKTLDQQWEEFSQQMTERLRQAIGRLDALATRVEEALRRLDGVPNLPEGVARSVPWATEAISYLDHRQEGGAPNGCPLPELFAAVRNQHPALSLTDFQDGLRRLNEHKALRLARFDGPAERLPEPEYALLSGADVLYYATR